MTLTIDQVKELKKNKRNFTQTIDLIVNLSNIDLKKPENRIREKVKLSHKIKDIKLCFIVDALLPQTKEINHNVLTKTNLDLKPREAKKLASNYDFFVIEAPLMPLVAKVLGKYVGPRNKPLIPIPPTTKDIKKVIEDLEKTASINLVKNPIIQIPIGKQDLEEKKIIENYKAAIDKIKELIEPKKAQIKSIYIKLTMSKPIKVL
ncbi:MAG TPA: 50S ribosomal protein L1 [Candidatus Aenigmarchaeota archaeon]|nr:50S ribosomal protein L1 [Candidatus Aenigmarchaeota archaeon]